MIVENNFLGRAGFYWFIGTVESRMDPLKLERVQVRCWAWDTDDKTQIPTDDLPWAYVSSHSANNSGVSQSSDYTEGSWVFGFFLDGIEAQQPFVLGSFPGIPMTNPNAQVGFSDARSSLADTPSLCTPTYKDDGTGSTFTSQPRGPYPSNLDEPDTSRMARADSKFAARQIDAKKASQAIQVGIGAADGSTFDEPAVAYAAKYPYNKVRETESGHTIELDDTPGAERVHVYHRTGSFVEILPDGSIIFKSVNDSYTFAMKNSYAHIDGKQTTTIDKGYDLLINADAESNDYNVKIGSGGNHNLTIEGGDMNVNITGNVNEKITGDVVSEVDGSYTGTIKGAVQLTCNSTVKADITGNTTLNVNGNTSLTTPKLTVDCPNSTFSGKVTVGGLLTAQASVSVTGTVTSSGDTVAGGISLMTHTHTSASPGSPTSPPM